MDVYEQAAEFRRQLLQREARAVGQLTASYQHTAAAVTARVEALERRIADRMATGTVPVSWLWQSARLQDVLDDIQGEVGRWATGRARGIAAAAVDQEASIGPTVAMEMVMSRLKPLPTAAARSLVRMRPQEAANITARLQAGAPLDRLFSRIAREQADRVRDAMITAVTSNQDPLRTIREIAPLVDGGLVRARTIVRTETMRTTREAQRQTWQQRGGLVTGWRWWSTLDRTVCPVCWAMHGTVHDINEPFGTHPQCRCSMLPELAPQSVTGLPLEDIPPPRTGVDVFADLPAGTQRRILGPAKHNAYLAGDLTLPDVVRFRHDPTWGPTRSEAPLERVVRTTPPVADATGQPDVAPTAPVTKPTETVDVFTAKSGMKAEVRRGVDQAMRIIDDLFAALPFGRAGKPLPVEHTSARKRYVAVYETRVNGITHNYRSSRIVMTNSHTNEAAGTYLHEFGHYIDFELIDRDGPLRLGGASSATDPGDLAEWLAAVKASNGYQAIERSPRLGGYFAKSTEVFARSFAQWAALRSGDTELLRSVIDDTWASHIAQGSPHPQWTDPQDFAPIASALDTLFRKKGWMT